MWEYIRDASYFRLYICAAENVRRLSAYFMMQGAVVSSMHPDDGLQTGRRARGLRYRPAR